MTLIIFTAEHLIIENANQNSGLRVRIQEYQVPKWTDDAEHAIRLKMRLNKITAMQVQISLIF